MKKLLAMLLILAMLLCSCNGKNKPDENGYVHEYDKKNDRIISSVRYENDVEASRIDYTYDEAGNLTVLTTTENGEVVQTLTHTYKDNVLASTAKEFKDVEDSILCKEYSEFDGEGKAFFTIYYENGEWVGRENYSYNDTDDLIRKDRVDESGEFITSEVYTYNQVNQIIRTDCYEFGLLVFYYEYEYDSAGDMSKATMFEPDGTLIGEIN